jgi:hypothetical protein
MAKKALCKRQDMRHHIAIARLIMHGVSCRDAVMRIAGQIGGNNSATCDRLYRNHLKNRQAYQEIVQKGDAQAAKMSLNGAEYRFLEGSSFLMVKAPTEEEQIAQIARFRWEPLLRRYVDFPSQNTHSNDNFSRLSLEGQ